MSAAVSGPARRARPADPFQLPSQLSGGERQRSVSPGLHGRAERAHRGRTHRCRLDPQRPTWSPSCRSPAHRAGIATIVVAHDTAGCRGPTGTSAWEDGRPSTWRLTRCRGSRPTTSPSTSHSSVACARRRGAAVRRARVSRWAWPTSRRGRSGPQLAVPLRARQDPPARRVVPPDRPGHDHRTGSGPPRRRPGAGPAPTLARPTWSGR